MPPKGWLTEKAALARELYAGGRIAEALAVHRDMAVAAPDNAVVFHNYAAALGDAGRQREAEAQARAAMAKGLDAPETWLVLARALVGLERFDEAEAAFRAVLTRRPGDAEAHRELAQLIWMLTGDFEKSLAALNDEIARQPHLLDLKLTRAHILGQTGDRRGEYEETLSALRESGGAAMLELAAANTALNAGFFTEALGHAERAAAGLPEEQAVRQAHVRAMLAVGDASGALRGVASLRARNPLDQNLIAVEATALRLLGDERYHALYDYDRFVRPAPLDAPKGWASLDNYLDDLIEALDKHHRYRTHPFGQSVRNGSQLSSIMALDEPALQAFEEAAAGPIARYFEAVGAGDDPLRARDTGRRRIASAWSIRLPSSGYHVDHVHPQGWISSACHLRFAENPEGGEHAGWLRFGAPGVPTAPALEAEHFIRPERGVLVLFPSYMWHGTIAFSGEPSRLTVAVDVVPG